MTMPAAAYPPDPTIHKDPAIAARCPYCHPKKPTRQALAEALGIPEVYIRPTLNTFTTMRREENR